MRARHNKKEKASKKVMSIAAALCFTMALVLLLTSMGATLAKYIKEDKSSGTAAAAPFYFTSDKLKETAPYYQIGAAGEDGMVKITFTLSNFVDDLRSTGKEIRYNLRTLSGGTEIPVTLELSGGGSKGTLPGTGKITQTVTLSLRQNQFGEDGTVTVTAEATSPYEKALSATFGFSAPKSGLQWEVREEKGAVVLEISGGEGKTVSVSWPSGLVPDPADSILQNRENGVVSFHAEAGERYALVFLKENPETAYGKANFSIMTIG